MSCPSDETRLSALLGELSVNEARALLAHRTGCVACRQALSADEQLLSDLAATPELAQSESAFTASVMAACAASPTASTHGRPHRRRVGAWSGVLALVASAAALFLVSPWSRPTQHFQARGISSVGASSASVDLLFVRDAVFYPLAGAALREGDALAVRYTNPGDVPKYLAVFALDAQRELHWIYPAFVDAAQNPSSVALVPGARGKLLSEVVEPEAPAQGKLQVFALVTGAPIHVRDIESLPRTRLTAEGIAAAFSGANLQTWRATWIHE